MYGDKTMKNLIGRLGAFLLLLAALQCGVREASAAGNSISIDAVFLGGNQLRLRGDFGNGSSVTVLLASTPLVVVNASAPEIVATVNPVPPVGTYRVDVTVDNKNAFAYVTVSAKILQGFVNVDGSIAPGSAFTAVHTASGHYRIEFPAGTFQIGAPYNFPVLTVHPVFGTTPANVTVYAINGDQSGRFEVDFGGIDTLFSFTVVQTY
jgi:hypothetical protein